MKFNHIPQWTVKDKVGLGFKSDKPIVSNAPLLPIVKTALSLTVSTRKGSKLVSIK